MAESCSITAVPYFLLYAGGREVARLEGADPAGLTALVRKHFQPLVGLPPPPPAAALPLPVASAVPPAEASQAEDAAKGGSTAPLSAVQLGALVKSMPVMLFMKGTPDAPRCGFSRRVVEALAAAGVSYGHFDILSNEQAPGASFVFSFSAFSLDLTLFEDPLT